jgi:hypothetical protein
LKRKNKKWAPIDYGRFVTLWEDSQTIDRVAQELGITNVYAGQIATKLRKLGVKLKKFPAGARRLQPVDVRVLNDLIQGLRST